MPKKISLEQLGAIMKKGFDNVNKRLGGVDKRLGAASKERQEIKKDIEDLVIITKNGFDEIDKNIANETNKRKAINNELADVKLKFNHTAWQIDLKELDNRVTTLEHKEKNGK